MQPYLFSSTSQPLGASKRAPSRIVARCVDARIQRVVLLTLGLWCGMIAVGVGVLVAHSQTPGSALSPSPWQPPADLLSVSAKPWHLVVGVHPRCPCTLATVSELQRLMRQSMDQMDCTVLVFAPNGAPADWTDTSSVRQVSATPGVRVVFDQDGATIRRLGMRTSGSTVLYNAAGMPQFYGGVTPSRGHEGVNLGVESIAAVIHNQRPPVITTPVFGCPITD